jgi:hypothetical protein
MKQGDVTFQDAAVILPSSYIQLVQKDMTDASGQTSYTGMGFRPSQIIFVSAVSSVVGQMSIGFGNDGDGANVSDLYNLFQNMYVSNSQILQMNVSSGNTYGATMESLDDDGFTVNWIKTGSPTGNLRMRYIAFK